MKITQIFNACNILVLQHLILILSLILILLTKVKKKIFILIFLMLVLFDPYNYFNKLLSQDNPHIFELIFFSFFIFIHIFMKKKIFYEIYYGYFPTFTIVFDKF